MRLATMLLLCLALPVTALGRTCDSCLDVEETISPTPPYQTVAGSTVGQPNGEYAYHFCAVQGGTYTFSTCDGPGYGGGSATYDTALSVWSGGAACVTQEACNDDSCSGGSSGLRSTVTFNAPASGDYIIVVDGFSTATGDFVLAYSGPECAVPVDASTWGQVKATYK